VSDIVCVGELLWDALPAGLFLGGAPFNVASHLHALGNEGAFVSRVGDDVLGDEAVRRLRARGLSADFVQKDDALPTGFVRVDLTTTDDPDYDIVAPAAWDAITLPDALQQRTRDADALVFGSLAQRDDPSRRTIQRLAAASACNVFDVNLRPPYVERAVVERSLALADVVKLNGDELAQLGTWFGLSNAPETAMADLVDTFDCHTVCVTWGGEGASLWHEGVRTHHPGHPVDVVDTVGAGDAFLSAFLSGLLDGRDGASLLDLANRLGAYVASHGGAFPPYEVDTLDDLRGLAPEAPPEAP
jgi:fructokinase